MNRINFNTFDLNLVRVFLALWEQRSVTAAAERLNLTQPAVSHALKRLRDHFDDPLFTRVGKVMEPTAAARRLYLPLKTSVDALRETMSSHGSFDPQSSDRIFTIAMSDISETYVLPKLLAGLMPISPGVRVRSVQLEAEEIQVKLRTGQVDLAFGYLPDLVGSEFEQLFLLEDRFICILRKEHPFAGNTLTFEAMKELDFVEVSAHATGYKMVREMLAQSDVKRNIRARIEHFSVIPEIVRSTDLAAIFPASVALRLVESGEFKTLELPSLFPTIEVCTHCHSSFHRDSGILWLNSLMRSLFA
jgi:DNA-binding transcriptional LysR family regulator